MIFQQHPLYVFLRVLGPARGSLPVAARSHTHTANQRSPLGEGCCHWLRGVSGRAAVWTGTEWAGDRELRLGFRLHHRRVVNPFEGRAGETGGDSVRCFSCTEGARPFPAEDRGLLSGVVSQTRPFLLGDGSCPAAAAGGSPELSPLPCAIRTAENQGRTRCKVGPSGSCSHWTSLAPCRSMFCQPPQTPPKQTHRGAKGNHTRPCGRRGRRQRQKRLADLRHGDGAEEEGLVMGRFPPAYRSSDLTLTPAVIGCSACRSNGNSEGD
ncbi:uncharacterized protein LOC132385808 [Hypanus sabinus]|uniref:uncharacterized protein LOC132385808 n=1 Tax=Hypanus sabinus TaxID=79690 RepID=UPI0028C4EDCB|nr:uncharacterized protein LOC132385808 [Hypanus sabinus]